MRAKPKFTQRDARQGMRDWAAATKGIFGKTHDTPDDKPLKPRKKPEYIESRYQQEVVLWWNRNCSRWTLPKRALYAVPNAGKRGITGGNRLQAEGLRAGVPDLQLDVARHGYHGFRLEMKQGKGTLSEDQREHASFLLAQGYHVETHWTAESAIQAIETYLTEA